MKPQCLLTLATVALLTTGLRADDKQDLEKMQGTWVVASLERDGKKQGEDVVKGMKRIVKGDKYTLTDNDKEVATGTFKINAGASPKTIDITRTTPDGNSSTMQAIYEVDGDTYKICYVGPGKPRPTTFSSADGATLAVWKKAK